MNIARSLWASVQNDPIFMRAVHGWLTVLWFISAPPTCVLAIMYPDSKYLMAYLVIVSVYAVVVGHWSTYGAARVEVKQEQEQDAA